VEYWKVAGRDGNFEGEQVKETNSAPIGKYTSLTRGEAGYPGAGGAESDNNDNLNKETSRLPVD